MTNSEEEADEERRRRQRQLSAQVAAATAAVAVARVQSFFHLKMVRRRKRNQGRVPGSITIKRERRDLGQLFLELGPTIFRRMYRMHEFSFWLLSDLLSKSMPDATDRARGTTPNGVITIPTRIAMALRWMAGGSKCDIGATHGVHPDEVYRSLWLVVDAIHATKELDITFPTSHVQQQAMADSFKKKSKCGFWNCVAAIDGMLVWTSQPSESTDDMGIGPAKFYNGRKCKFGMNMQGICGPDKKFLDITCCHPGSASDFTMWLDSSLRKKLESPGFLKPGLVLYGDNAYVNTPEMVTPFKAVSKGPKDNYNFYHSQLRITIEGAFGMLVHKWACLRKPMPPNLEVSKISRLVLALAKLHNFCIDQRMVVEDIIVEDRLSINDEGGFDQPSPDRRVVELLDGGIPGREDKEYREAIRDQKDMKDLPIFEMLEYIENNNYTRPVPLPNRNLQT